MVPQRAALCLLLVVSVALLLPQPTRSQTSLVSPAAPPFNSPQYKTPLSPQQLEGGYWRTDVSFAPVLHITNILVTGSLRVTPVLYMADGTEYALPAVLLPPEARRRLISRAL